MSSHVMSCHVMSWHVMAWYGMASAQSPSEMMACLANRIVVVEGRWTLL